MKKFLAAILALALALSMTACGSAPDEAAPAEPAAPSSEAAAPSDAASPEADAPSVELTPEQLAVAEKFAAMSDRYTALADKINADEKLLAVKELVDTMNALADAINEDDAIFADPAKLTPEVLTNLDEGIVVGNDWLAQLEAMVENYSGKETVTIPVEIINDTKADLYTLAMSPTSDTNWGSNLLTAPLKNGETGTTEMTFTADTLVWDLMAADAEGTSISFIGIDFSKAPTTGAKLVLASEDGSYTASFVS